MIKEYLFKKLLDASLEKAKNILKESDTTLLTPKDRMEESISYHLQAIENWSAEISFADLKKARHIDGIFIELDLFVYPRRLSQDNEIIESIPLTTIFDYSHRHPILLGQPGAGKTTSMKYLCQLLLHDEDFYSERFSFPILIKLRELQRDNVSDSTSIIIEQVYGLLGLNMALPEKTPKEDYQSVSRKIKEKLVVSVLEELKVLLILDGFDEIANKQSRDDALYDIRRLAIHLSKSTMVVTSRSGDFVYSVDNTTQYEISPLKSEQIKKFAIKWLQDEQLASDFLEKINKSPFADTTIRPLTLAHLCAIYEKVGKIPEKPKSIYKRIINLLLEKWDQQRSVKRASKYANFETDRKFEFICRLAYVLTISLQTTVFSDEDLRVAYYKIYRDYDLVPHEVNQVVDELETHTGLFLQSGYNQYEFAHKSLQEYLTAEFLVKLPSIPPWDEVLIKLPNELAIAVTISSDTSSYFSELILNRLNKQALTKDFCKAFISRLVLEKPDFNSHSTVCLSLLILYTSYVRQIIHALAPSYSEPIMIEFEALIKRVLSSNLSLPLSSYYDIESVYEQKNDEILFMVKKEIFNTVFADKVEIFPNELYVRKSFLFHSQEDSASL